MGGFVRQYRTPGGSVVPGGSSRSDHEEPVAPEPDGGMPADFDAERDEMPSGGLDLCLVEGLSFRRTVFGLETHVEERVFEFLKFRIGAGKNRRIGEEESLGSEVHSEKRGVFAMEFLYGPEHGSVSAKYGDGPFFGFGKQASEPFGSEGFAQFALSFGKPGVEYDGSSGDVQDFEAGHGMGGYGLRGMEFDSGFAHAKASFKFEGWGNAGFGPPTFGTDRRRDESGIPSTETALSALEIAHSEPDSMPIER